MHTTERRECLLAFELTIFCVRYSKLIMAIKSRTSLSDESVDMLQEIVDDDEGMAKQV